MRHTMFHALNNNARRAPLYLSCSVASMILVSSTLTSCDANTENSASSATYSSNSNVINKNSLSSRFKSFWYGDAQISSISINAQKKTTMQSKSAYPVELNDTTFMSRTNADNINNRGILPESHVGAFTVSGVESVPRSFLVDGNLSSNKLVMKKSKINQDRGCIVIPYGCNDDDTALFAVYDGHGKVGHKVSQFVCDKIENKLQNHPEFYSNVSKALEETFLIVNDELRNSPFEVSLFLFFKNMFIINWLHFLHNAQFPIFSGTTAVVMLLCNDILYVSNVGDSRAVLGEINNNNKINFMNLTTDHKPDKPSERQRIESFGGHVSDPPIPGHTARAWSCKERIGLGLAMSRSIGDFALKSSGVIALPEITMHPIAKNHNQQQFIILASDGVWDFVSSQEAVNAVGKIMNDGGTANDACKELTRISVNRWKEKSEDYRDDITVIVVKLNNLFSSLDT